MKHLLTAIACCLAVAGSAQFIPQPMGYNPDSNSDAFVGIDDLMAVLSLYGTPFDNGDSVDVVTLDFTGFENDTLSVPEGADVIYLLSGDSVTQYNDRYVLLPSGTSWKSLVFFGFSSFNESCLYRFISSGSFFDEGILSSMYGEVDILRGQNPEYDTYGMKHKILLRNHFGYWYAPAAP